jgi:uncharacterized membrane protein YqjE
VREDGAPGADRPGSGSGTAPPDARARTSPGIRDLLGRLAASVASALDTRVQLAVLEFTEASDRARERIVLVVIAAIASAFALLAANVLFVLLLWDRLGWVSLAILTLLWLAVAGFAGLKLAALSRRTERPFAATLAEFERDRAWIAERFGNGRK